MSDEIQEIKNRLSVEDVLREYITLRKAGVNFKACCPFHNEKTPSLIISPNKQIWHCFGCALGGDIFTFVQKIENVDFGESLRLLAKKAGVVLKKRDGKANDEKNVLFSILALTQKFFYVQLLKNAKGLIAREYLEKRGVTKDSIDRFGLGYSLEGWDSLAMFLSSRGYSESDMEKAGLVIKRENRGGFYDRFRHRLMFPIRTVNGDCIGFGGRILNGDTKSAKYINSPQSDLYNKSRVVYGLYEGKDAIRDFGGAIVVEGYMDVISNHQAGTPYVVASSGTAFTEEQLRLLRRYTDTLLFSFDSDVAGQSALARGVELALRYGMKIKVILIPSGFGKDPDECIKKDPAVWRCSVSDALPMMEYYYSRLLKDFIKQDVDTQGRNIHFCLDLIFKIPDVLEQAYWLQELSRKTQKELSLLKEIFNGFGENPAQQKVKTSDIRQKKDDDNEPMILYKQLFGLLMISPDLFSIVVSSIDSEMFFNEFFSNLYKSFLILYNKNNLVLPRAETGYFDTSPYISWLQDPHQNNEEFTVVLKKNNLDQLISALDRLLISAQDIYAGVDVAMYGEEVKFLCGRIRDYYVRLKIREVTIALDNTHDQEEIARLTNEFNRLINYYK